MAVARVLAFVFTLPERGEVVGLVHRRSASAMVA